MGRLMSQPLDRERPLWETWLVEGLEGGRWALVLKIHHCMVDGIAGVELLTVLLDPEPARRAERHRAVGAGARAAGSDQGPRRVGRPGGRRHPHRTRRPGRPRPPGRDAERRRSTPSRASPGSGADWAHAPLSIEGPIGPHRAWAHSVGQPRRREGHPHRPSAAPSTTWSWPPSAEATATLLTSRGEDPDHAVVRSLVPVSTRGDDAHGVPDNQVTALLYDLPVQIADPVERLRAGPRRR